MPCPGQYLEVVPNRKLVFTDAFTGDWEPKDGAPFMVATVTFEPEGDKTRYTAMVRHWSEADRAPARRDGLPSRLGQMRRPARSSCQNHLRRTAHDHQSITPFLWFDTQAEDAAKYYVSLFPNSKITHVSRYGDAGPGPKGSVMVVAFELMGQRLLLRSMADRHYKLDEAFSLSGRTAPNRPRSTGCGRRLSEGGTPNVCGWTKDKFGLSWQINYAGIAGSDDRPQGGQGDGRP